MSTRFGRFTFALHRLTITFPAEEGEDLHVEATVAIGREWPGPPVIGFRGLLDRLRFAVDPGVDPGHPALFYFGPCG